MDVNLRVWPHKQTELVCMYREDSMRFLETAKIHERNATLRGQINRAISLDNHQVHHRAAREIAVTDQLDPLITKLEQMLKRMRDMRYWDYCGFEGYTDYKLEVAATALALGSCIPCADHDPGSDHAMIQALQQADPEE